MRKIKRMLCVAIPDDDVFLLIEIAIVSALVVIIVVALHGYPAQTDDITIALVEPGVLAVLETHEALDVIPSPIRVDFSLTVANTQTQTNQDYAPLDPDPVFSEEPEIGKDWYDAWVEYSQRPYAIEGYEEEPLAEGAPLRKLPPPLTSDDGLQPLYEVYKNSYPVNAPAHIQWMIRDFANEFGFDERYIIGMIVAESTFHPRVINENCRGLSQINPYWLRSSVVERFSDDPRSRDLYEPYDNLLTLMEIWCYARRAYDLDTDTEIGMLRLLYWHNTGKDPTNVTRWGYASRIFGYVDELVSLETRREYVMMESELME